MEYGNGTFPFFDLRVIAGVLIFLALVILSLRSREGNRLLSFSIAWFLIALAPQSNLYPINAYMAEHWLYLPSMGFFLILGKALGSLFKRPRLKPLALALAALLVAYYSSLTIQQNTYWRDPIAFYERTLTYAPDSPRVYNNLGTLYSDAGRHEESIASLRKAIELKPAFSDAFYNLGKAYNAIGKYQEAIASYRRAIELNPAFAYAYYNLALAYAACGKHDEAIASYKKAIEVNPEYADACYNLGNEYGSIGQHKEAIASYKRAIEINTHFVYAYNNLGNAYSTIGQYEEAIASYKKALELRPDYAEAYCNLSAAYLHAKHYRLAIEYCDRAKALGLVNNELLETLKPYREK
jgi:tetratricopeptide (TPR) repeat protein